MTEQERLELEQLKRRQVLLQTQVASLSRELEHWERRLTEAAPLATPPPRPAPAVVPPPLPLTMPAAPPVPVAEKLPLPPVRRVQPLPLPVAAPAPPILKVPESPPQEPTPIVLAPVPPAAAPPIAEEPPLPPRLPVPVFAQTAMASAAAPKEASFEMRLGTYWFVRIGAVLVLTGLVFFGNLAYQKLGPGGKVSLLYLASGLLLGAGAWWQRKAAKESLQNYAQVLFAGGLAAVYFTTYAAHHFPNLQVIRSAMTDGALLLAWAGFMVWIADRKKSELLALFSVGLAYYSAVITHVGTFTLWSNLVLAAAAVFFLVRNRWAALSYASLAATYASYTWWRFIHGHGWEWVSPEEGLWLGASFLIGYWAIFTTAVFLSRDERFAGPPRAGFLTLNNASFFALFVLTMWQVRTGSFWKLSLTCGVVLMVLSALARRVLASEPLAWNAYLTQGLLLITVGFIAKFSGLNLALVLGVESVALLSAGLWRKSLILQIGGYLTAALAAGWALDSMEQTDGAGLYAGIGLGAMLVFNALTVRRAHPACNEHPVLPAPAYFTALALLTWLCSTWTYTAHANVGLVLAIEALALTLAIFVLPLPEIAVLGQGFVLCAQAAWQFHVPDNIAQFTALVLAAEGVALLWLGGRRQLPILQVGACVAAAFAVAWGIQGMERNATSGLLTGMALTVAMIFTTFLSHRQSGISPVNTVRPGPTYFSLLAIVLAGVTTWFNTSQSNCPLALVAVGIVLTLSVYALGVVELALLAQTLAFVGHVLGQGNLFDHGAPRWWNPLLMIGMTLGLGHWWQRQTRLKTGENVAPAMQFVWALAMVGLTIAWLGRTCADPTWLGIASLLAVGVTVYAAATRAWMLAACAQLFLLPAVWLFCEQLGKGAEPRLVPLAPIATLGLLSFFWVKQRSGARPEMHASLSMLATVYRWVALVMSLWWVLEYIPEREQIWVLTLIGLMVFLAAGALRSREAQLISAAFSGVAVVLFGLRAWDAGFVYLPNLLAVLVWLGQQRIAKRQAAHYGFHDGTHGAIILLGGLSLWLFVSRWVAQGPGGFYLTASWSVLALALLAGGMVLRERMYRWLGLAVLAAALGRVVMLDVWRLETNYRVLSFLALGLVLLVLGFIYNRYQEKIRQWL